MNGERWDATKFDKIQGVPWEPIPGRSGADVRSKMVVSENQEAPTPMQIGSQRGVVRKRLKIGIEDRRSIGFTVGC